MVMSTSSMNVAPQTAISVHQRRSRPLRHQRTGVGPAGPEKLRALSDVIVMSSPGDRVLLPAVVRRPAAMSSVRWLSVRAGRGGAEAVAAPDRADRGRVRRAVGGGGEDPAEFAEVGGADPTGRPDPQDPRVDAAVVLEAEDLPARHADRLAGPDLDGLAVDRPGRAALEPVDRLVKAVVAVHGWHPCAGGDGAFEDGRTPVRVGGLDQEAEVEHADGDRVVIGGLGHRGSLPWLGGC